MPNKVPKCKHCQSPMRIYVKLTGGCNGHDYGDRCYCDSPDVRVAWVCTQMKSRACDSYEIQPKGLTDRYSIERWLTEKHNTGIINLNP